MTARGPIQGSSQNLPPKPWVALEERRFYGGGSQEQAAREAKSGLEEALGEGYLVESIEWAPDSRSVIVSYVYDPARTARQL